MNGGEKRKNEREREAGALMERGSTGASIYRDEMFDSHGQNGQCASKTPARVVSRRDGVWTTLHLLERKIMTNDYGKPFRGSRNRVCGELVMVRRAANESRFAYRWLRWSITGTRPVQTGRVRKPFLTRFIR